MNRKRRMKQLRRNVMRLGTVTREELLNKDEDGTRYPDKKDWGYVVEVTVNGYRIASYSGSYHPYEAWTGCYDCAKWAMTQPTFVKENTDGEV